MQGEPLSTVAVTGGMGSGKSSVARYLSEISGALFVDADGICRQLLEPGASGWLALRAAFAERFFEADHCLDRVLLRKAIFADDVLRNEVNALLHPLVRNEIHECVMRCGRGGAAQRVVVEVPLLYEARWQDDFLRVVVVYADSDVCLDRIVARDHVGREEALRSMGKQIPLFQKSVWADHVIYNNGPWSESCLQIHHLNAVLWPEK